MNTYEKHRGGGRVPNLRGTFSLTLCLGASVANPMFSAVCRLFVVALRSFPHSLPLFSIDCSLFSQNTRVGVGRGPSRQTFQHGALTLLARVASSTLASPTILRPLLRITGGRPRAGCNLSDSQRLENRRPKFFEHVAAGNNPHLNSVSLKRLPSGPLGIRQIGVGQAFGAQRSEQARDIRRLSAGVRRRNYNALQRVADVLREAGMREREIPGIMVEHGRQQKHSKHVRGRVQRHCRAVTFAVSLPALA